jgi:hypothetical protein
MVPSVVNDIKNALAYFRHVVGDGEKKSFSKFVDRTVKSAATPFPGFSDFKLFFVSEISVCPGNF